MVNVWYFQETLTVTPNEYKSYWFSLLEFHPWVQLNLSATILVEHEELESMQHVIVSYDVGHYKNVGQMPN